MNTCTDMCVRQRLPIENFLLNLCLWHLRVYQKVTQSQTHDTNMNIVKLVLSGHSKITPKIDFWYRLSLNAGQKYCRMLQGESILQHCRPSLSYHFPLRTWLCIFLSGRLIQGLLYWYVRQAKTPPREFSTEFRPIGSQRISKSDLEPMLDTNMNVHFEDNSNTLTCA